MNLRNLNCALQQIQIAVKIKRQNSNNPRPFYKKNCQNGLVFVPNLDLIASGFLRFSDLGRPDFGIPLYVYIFGFSNLEQFFWPNHSSIYGLKDGLDLFSSLKIKTKSVLFSATEGLGDILVPPNIEFHHLGSVFSHWWLSHPKNASHFSTVFSFSNKTSN